MPDWPLLRSHRLWGTALPDSSTGQSASPGWTSLEARLAAAGRRPSGFDYLRVILALCVIIWHAFPLSYGGRAILHALPSRWILVPVDSVVPMFFAIGGFLVPGSLERSRSVLTFMALRLIRIVPALVVETILSAVVIGPLLTVVSLAVYFSSHEFFGYFLNIVAFIHYTLPGVFLHTPSRHFVNAQLWTIPWEYKSYIMLALFGALGIARNRWLVLAAAVGGLVVVSAWGLHYRGPIADPFSSLMGYRLLISFLAGVSLYNFREEIPWNGWLFAGCVVAQGVLIGLGGICGLLASFPIAYVTVFLGLTNAPRLAIVRGNDFSYGVYLYGYVVQQAMMDVLPWAHHWYLNLVVSLPVIAALAAFSWFVVEKPAQRLKRLLPDGTAKVPTA